MLSTPLKETDQDITSSWKYELETKLNSFCHIAENFNGALVEASQYLDSHIEELSGYYLMIPIVKEWLDSICKIANDDSKYIGDVKITADLLPSVLREFDFPHSEGLFAPEPKINGNTPFSKASDELLKDWIIENFDFELLGKSIAQVKSEIQNLNFSGSAEVLIQYFKLFTKHYQSDNDLVIKTEKGRYLLEIDHYGNLVLDRTKSLTKLRKNAAIFESESDTSGLTHCLQILLDEENKLPKLSNCNVATRTKVAEDCFVSATFFKGKIKFSFAPTVFEALISFVRTYKNSDTQLKHITIG